MSKDKLQLIRNTVKSYEDFPKPGVVFRDVFPVLRNPEAFKVLIELCLEHMRRFDPPVEVVVALESRGFLFGPVVALELGVPFVPIRKKGKLPGKLKALSYSLEYGQDTIEVQEESIQKGQRVIIVDDLLATGGTMSAACTLMDAIGAETVECFAVLELTGLGGRARLSKPVYSLLQY